MELIEKVFQNSSEIFKHETRKDPNYHFGFRQWDDIQLAILEHIWTKLSSFDSTRPLKPWLKKTIHHQIINQKRNCAHRNKIEARIFSNNKDAYAAIAYLNNDPPASKINSEINNHINDAFLNIWKNLSFREKKISILYFDKNISCAIISIRYNMSRRHAHQIVRTIKDRILKELQKRKIHIRK